MMPYFIEIARSAAEMLRFFDVFKIVNFLTVGTVNSVKLCHYVTFR